MESKLVSKFMLKLPFVPMVKNIFFHSQWDTTPYYAKKLMAIITLQWKMTIGTK
jgi:hypothetical protein